MPGSEDTDWLAVAHEWVQRDQYGAINRNNLPTVTAFALLSIATDVRRIAEAVTGERTPMNPSIPEPNRCQGCEGDRQDGAHEVLKYDPRRVLWLCQGCRSVSAG